MLQKKSIVAQEITSYVCVYLYGCPYDCVCLYVYVYVYVHAIVCYCCVHLAYISPVIVYNGRRQGQAYPGGFLMARPTTTIHIIIL